MRDDALPLISVVVPVYGNAPDLRALHSRLSAAAGSIAPHESEFVFVDDGSADESFERLALLAGEDPRVRVLGLSRNSGPTRPSWRASARRKAMRS